MRKTLAAFVVLAGASLAACSSSSQGQPAANVDAGDGASNGDGGGLSTGAGPEGDLPSGYCCTTDEDCRNRHCVDVSSGNKMCEDECDGSQSTCSGQVNGLQCSSSDASTMGFCEPLSPTMKCVPANQYQHGNKPDGSCCTPTGDATAGQECLSGNCGAFGPQSNPFLCLLACDASHRCASNAQCTDVGAYSVCAPLATNYTCK